MELNPPDSSLPIKGGAVKLSGSPADSRLFRGWKKIGNPTAQGLAYFPNRASREAMKEDSAIFGLSDTEARGTVYVSGTSGQRPACDSADPF